MELPNRPDQAKEKREKIRQAVVVVHGMGEHRPLETLNGFIAAGLPPVAGVELIDQYYSRPDEVTDSYEARRYLAPRQPTQPPYADDPEIYAQTEFFEYHWAHLMQGNKLSDLRPAMTRLLFRRWSSVPEGLRVVWVGFWILIAAAIWFFIWGPGSELAFSGSLLEDAIRVLVGTGLIATAAAFLVVNFLGGWATSSFVDVVRYLDTSPRSYAVRHDIRKGIVDLLQGLHDSGKYKRIVIVAHSLGSYIAHDGITFLWGTMNTRHAGAPGPGMGTVKPAGLEHLEKAASDLVTGWEEDRRSLPSGEHLEVYRDAQRDLWQGVRENGNPWLITDLITLGSPMYFADRLYTKNYRQFRQRVKATEFPTCPPESDPAEYNNIHHTKRYYSYRDRTGRRVLYHGALFAVVRWTNMWFPAHLWFFGDWFGGPLAPLYGPGIMDIRLKNKRFWPRFWTRFPAVAHARYFRYPKDQSNESATTRLRDAMGLASGAWLSQVKPPVRRRRASKKQAAGSQTPAAAVEPGPAAAAAGTERAGALAGTGRSAATLPEEVDESAAVESATAEEDVELVPAEAYEPEPAP